MVSNFGNIKGAQSFKFVVKTIQGQKCAWVKVAYFGQQMDLLGKLSTTKATKLWTLSVSPLAPRPPSLPRHSWGCFRKSPEGQLNNVPE